jgi:phage tail-like protein
MAERSDGRPYSQFNFLVDLDAGEDARTSFRAGFQEVSGLGFEVNVAEYRAGNWPENSTRKISGTYKSTDVTLKRGLIGARDLFDWVQKVREGQQGEDVRRTVTITLQSEDRQSTAAIWKLLRAFPTKYTAPTMNGNGTDLAVEELTLACERIDMLEQ